MREEQVSTEPVATGYAVARGLAIGARDGNLRHGPVRPHWLADGRHFWYAVRRDNDTIEYVLVDTQALQRRPLFDGAAVLAALARATGHAVPGDALEAATLRVADDLDHVDFAALGTRWRWQASAQALSRLGPAFAPHERVSPNGKWAVSLNGADLALRRVDEPTPRPLTTDGEADHGWGDFIDYTMAVSRRLAGTQSPAVLWSPDSARLAVLRVDRRAVPRHHLVQSVPPVGKRPVLHSYPFPYVSEPEREQVALWFIDREGRRVRAALDSIEGGSHRPFALGQGRWAADGRHFFFADHDLALTRATLWRIDVHTGHAERLIEERGPAMVRLSPTLGMPPLFHMLADGRCIGWTQRSGWGHLAMFAPDGSCRPITQASSQVLQVRQLLHVDEVASRIVFVAASAELGANPYHDHVYRIDFDGDALVRLTPEAGHHELLQDLPGGSGEADGSASIRPDGRCFVDSFSTLDTPPRALLRADDGLVLMDLETAIAAPPWPPGQPVRESVSMTLPGLDEALWGTLYKPLGFDPAQRYPVVECLYAAPQTAMAPHAWPPGMLGALAEQLAAVGFVALIIDGPGTPFRSHAFQRAAHGRTEACGLPERVQAIEQLAQTRPWMDLARVGVVGGSGGGFAVLRAMASHPDFYKAGVSICGSHDQGAYLPLWSTGFHGPWDEALYERQENACIAAQIRGDLLLVHGELDDNVHPAQTLRIVDALIRADRDFDMLLVPGAGHTVAALPYVQRRTLDFFVRHLTAQRQPRRTAEAER